MISKNYHRPKFLSVFLIAALFVMACGEEETEAGNEPEQISMVSGEWSIQARTIQDGCGVFGNALEELTANDGETKTLTFSDDQSSLTISDDDGTLNCTMSNQQFTCALTDEMRTDLTEKQLIREDIIEHVVYDGTVIRTVVIGGSFDSGTTGKLTVKVSVTCEGETCPQQVQLANFGTISLPCTSSASAPITN